MNWQVLPEQAPLKPEKLYPDAGVAERVTLVPSPKLALQVPGQSMPEGLLVTVPVPDTVTLSCAGGMGLKVAETDVSPAKTMLHDDPEHAPLKLPKE